MPLIIATKQKYISKLNRKYEISTWQNYTIVSRSRKGHLKIEWKTMIFDGKPYVIMMEILYKYIIVLKKFQLEIFFFLLDVVWSSLGKINYKK